MELKPQLQQSQQTPRSDPIQDLQPLPDLKSKTRIKLSPLGELDIEAEGLSANDTKELTNFVLSINADNLLRQRAIKDVCKDSEDIFSHLIAFTLISGISLFGVYAISKVFTPQHTYSFYGESQHIV
jgi:hypothetical protein